MSRRMADAEDRIDRRRAQWAAVLPDIDTRGMAMIGRMRWITLRLRPGIEAIFVRHGLDTGEFDVLSTLLQQGEPFRMRPTELYRSLMISSGGLTARIDRLAQAGLVERQPAPDDARSLLVILTAKGRRLAEQAFREDMAWEAAALEALTADEQDRLSALLRKLALAVEARAEP